MVFSFKKKVFFINLVFLCDCVSVILDKIYAHLYKIFLNTFYFILLFICFMGTHKKLCYIGWLLRAGSMELINFNWMIQ